VTRTSKPDLGGGVSHPARFSAGIIELFAEMLTDHHSHHSVIHKVLDPFAGTGRIHELRQYGFDTTGVEIEPEWAMMHPDTFIGDATNLPFATHSFDAVVTSPCYGNRFADHHKARDGSVRRSYTHDLGRDLDPNNAGAMHWGNEYRQLHIKAWTEARRVLSDGGVLILNIKDHIRSGKRQFVSGWHVTTLCRLGFDLLYHCDVPVRGLRLGGGRELRLPSEQIYLFEKHSLLSEEKHEH